MAGVANGGSYAAIACRLLWSMSKKWSLDLALRMRAFNSRPDTSDSPQSGTGCRTR